MTTWRKAELIENLQARQALLSRIRTFATELELKRLGVADPTLKPEPELLDRWLAEGRDAGMSYLGRHRDLRLSPERFFPGVAAIISVAVGYRSPARGQGTGPGDDPRISCYARGDDYHKAIKDRLFLLLAEIKKMVPEVKGRVAVDTAPVLERHWAEQAGLGWIGRNRCLITTDLGSWVFLGELFLDIPLPFNSAAENRCGTCRRCLESCPTTALDDVNGLDSRACIAYWNVEYRGEFTAETPHLSPWLFGCDACQDVCPWNQKASFDLLSDLHPRGGTNEMPQSTEDWSRLTDRLFTSHLAATAMERTGPDGLRRNARRILAEPDRDGKV
jgi:epoxyqueuosine reductase